MDRFMSTAFMRSISRRHVGVSAEEGEIDANGCSSGLQVTSVGFDTRYGVVANQFCSFSAPC